MDREREREREKKKKKERGRGRDIERERENFPELLRHITLDLKSLEMSNCQKPQVL